MQLLCTLNRTLILLLRCSEFTMERNSTEPATSASPLTAERLTKTIGHHPHITLKDLAAGHGSHSLLDYVIAHGRLRERTARKFALPDRKRRVVHRNIKLENILLSDFAAVFDPRGRLDTYCWDVMICHTPYVGPEVDVWGLGAVIYILVCGKVPFDAPDPEALRVEIKRGSVTYPSHLNCRNVLSRMLTMDAASRAPLSEVLSHPWMTGAVSGAHNKAGSRAWGFCSFKLARGSYRVE
ncbi:kinase-like domain-containing protein [Mycena filopes]|nr:kinase-like domain-containing protein [Mycena filopes]